MLDDAFTALGIGRDDAALVAAAVRQLMRTMRSDEVEAFVQLRWHGRCHRQSIVQSAAEIVRSGA